MKRLRLLVAGACLVSSGLTYGKVTVSKGGEEQTFDFQIDGTSFRSEVVGGQAFNHVVLEGLAGYEAIDFAPGAPQLPVVRFYVDGAVSISATEGGGKATLTSELPVVPSLRSAAKIAGEIKVLDVDSESYQKSQSPKKFLEVETVGSVRGVVRQLVTLNPVSYDPVTGAVYVKKEFKVTVKTAGAKDEPSILLAQQMVFLVGSQFAANSDLQAYIAAKQSAGFRTIEHVR